MTFIPKAVIFGDEQGFSPLLKEFLFKSGLRETMFAKSHKDLGKFLGDGFWPIVFIDHAEGSRDGFSVYDMIQKQPGHEFLTAVFVAPQDKKVFSLFAQSLGASGVIHKPLQLTEATPLLKRIIPPAGDPTTLMAMQASRCMLRGELNKAIPLYGKLLGSPQHRKSAEIALARCEIRVGQVVKAGDRLVRLLQSDERDVRVLAELGTYYRRTAQHTLSAKCFAIIRNFHSQMTFKVWDQMAVLLEADEFDQAALLCEDLIQNSPFREAAMETLARVALTMGLANYIPVLLKAHPNLTKQFNQFATLNLKATA